MELRDRRIVVQWNIGSGTRMVTNTHTINYIAPGDRNAWYHITLERCDILSSFRIIYSFEVKSSAATGLQVLMITI